MSIEFLELILPPPIRPIEVPTPVIWQNLECELPTLPPDFQAFLARYGTGVIDGFIWIFNPASVNEHLNLLTQVCRQSEVYEELGRHGADEGVKLFPVPGGALPFGITDNGDLLLWDTGGSADEWTIIVAGARWRVARFAMNMTQFLAKVLSRQMECAIFPPDFPGPSPQFTSRN